MSPSTHSLVVLVAKCFTTACPTTLIFAPCIQLHSLLVNDPQLRKTQTHQLRNDTRGQTKQVTLQSQSPHRLLLQVLAGKRIPFLSLQTLFLVVKKTLLMCTDNTGHKSGPDLATRTDYKTGIICACPRSVLQAFANS